MKRGQWIPSLLYRSGSTKGQREDMRSAMKWRKRLPEEYMKELKDMKVPWAKRPAIEL